MITFTHAHRVLIAIVTIILMVCAWFLITWVSFLRSPIIFNEQGMEYVVPEGASIRLVVHDLYLLNVIKRPVFFNLLVYLRGDKHELKAGEYLFPKGTTPVSLLTQITTGSGMVYHTFTIVAGWSFHTLRGALEKDPNLRHASASMSNAAIMDYLGHPELKPEGWFFPDTYYFVKGSSDLVLLKRAFQMMQRKLNDAWKKRDSDLPYQTQQEVLTVASLIEKETGVDRERSMIAGVIVNRLRKDMLLQIDSSVIYGVEPHFTGVIRRKDLLSKNPYNTYVNKGLPPTPIAMPGMESIEAALHPKRHNYYYFVAKNYDPDGGHQFSTTLAEHYKAVANAKRKHSRNEFFNDNLIRAYFLKLVLPKIYN
ncbi:MAG: hypothetical protein ACD_45C00303G0006 [uncultured bacterium]|nr:MAG: hypothetical protein ACD_45C00303G0006 [uncultured bacterium]